METNKGKIVRILTWILLFILSILVLYRIYILQVKELIIIPENQAIFLLDNLSHLHNKHFFFISKRKTRSTIEKINPFLMDIVLQFNLKQRILKIHTTYDQPVFIFNNYLVSCRNKYPYANNNLFLPVLQSKVSSTMEKTIARDIAKLFPIYLLTSIELSKKGWVITTSNNKSFFLGPVWNRGIGTLDKIGADKILKIINNTKYQMIYVLSSDSILLKI
jgi:uncharacterized membrane protein